MREKHAVRLGDSGSLWLEDEGMLLLNRTITDMDIIDMYHRLRKIEDSFKITKAELDARPIFFSRRDRLDGTSASSVCSW